MLTTTNKSVQEISDILGFSSTSYFRKILKLYTDKTPLKIRKEAVF
jgi:transcriptional regulator GlxA family with amidase domain